MVAALALLAAVTGLCVGCELYRIGARLRGIRTSRFERVELADLGYAGGLGSEIVVAFGHPLCSDCTELEATLRRDGRPVLSVDVRARPDLARRYGIALVPTAVAVAPDGRVLGRLAG
jgi:hypothetical protein